MQATIQIKLENLTLGLTWEWKCILACIGSYYTLQGIRKKPENQWKHFSSAIALYNYTAVVHASYNLFPDALTWFTVLCVAWLNWGTPNSRWSLVTQIKKVKKKIIVLPCHFNWLLWTGRAERKKVSGERRVYNSNNNSSNMIKNKEAHL